MTYKVHTQTLENYGAHSESGKFEDGKAYWKFKGGTTYIVTGVDRLQDAVAFIASIATANNIFYKEFVSSYEEVVISEATQDEYGYVVLDVPAYMAANEKTRNLMKSKFIYNEESSLARWGRD